MNKIVVLIFLNISILFSQESYDIENVENSKTKASMQKWLDGNFGLKPYRVNYILPYGYREDSYVSKVPSIEYTNIEAELQVSLKLQIFKDIFKLHERYYISYTQQAFWQLYANSAPFRESLYNPEVFIEFPIDDDISIFNLRTFTFGYAHRSNGQPDTSGITFSTNQTLENMSRSLNYIYGTIRMQYESLITDITLLATISDLSDNPDIMDYYGYSNIKFTYFINKHMFTLYARGNMITGNGAVEATYSYPLISDTNLYVKIFSGYGESLIDYDNQITKFSIGFSFSR